MEKAAFTKENVIREASQVLKGCKLISTRLNTDGCGVRYIFQYQGSKIYVFANYDNAQYFIDTTLKAFLKEHPQNVIPMLKEYIRNVNIEDFFNEKLLFKHIRSKYDEMVGSQFSNYNKQAVLEEIEKAPYDFIKSVVKNDAQLSAFMFPVFDIDEVVDAIADGLEFRVYEHGSFYYVPEVKLG
jgi:hypothetical protein